MRVRGRYLVIAWTAVFLAAAGTIVFRSWNGFRMMRHLTAVNDTTHSLEGIRVDVTAAIERLKSRGELGRKAAATGLRFASDTDFHRLRVPVAR